MKKFKKNISILLIFVMLFTLASCKGAGEVVDNDVDVVDDTDDEEEDVVEPVEEDDPHYANADLATKNVYEVTLVDTPDENGYFVASGKTDEGAYYVHTTYDRSTCKYSYNIYIYDGDGNLKDNIALGKPLDLNVNEDINGIGYEDAMDLLKELKIDCRSVDDVSYSYFHRDSDGNYESIISLWITDSKGENIHVYFDVLWDKKGECTDIEYIPVELNGAYVDQFAYLADGSLMVIYGFYFDYGYDMKGIVYGPDRFYDYKSSVIAESDVLGDWTSRLGNIILIDDKPVALYWDWDNDYDLFASEIDPETFEAGEKIQLKPLGVPTSYINGITDDGDILVSLNSGIQSFKIGEKGKVFMDFVNSDISASSCSNIVCLDGLDEFYGAFYVGDDSYKIALCKAVSPESVEKSKVFTLATDRVSYELVSSIVKFNTSGNGYRIVLRDYSLYESENNLNAGLDKMYEDMTNGRMSDVVYIDSMNYIDIRSLVEKDLVADIGELIDKDSSISIDDYCTNVFDAASVNGNLYQIIPTFTVDTVFGSSAYVDGSETLTIDNFLDYAEEVEANGDMMYNIYMTRNEFMSNIINNVGYYWIDVDGKTCDFNDPSFYKLLGYSLTLPEQTDYNSDLVQRYWDNYNNLMIDGILRFKGTSISGSASEYFYDYADCNADPVFVGWPSPDGNGSSIRYSSYIVLSKDSIFLDEAWDYAKYFLTDYQDIERNYALPVLKSALEDSVARYGKPYTRVDEDGNQIEYTYEYNVGDEVYVSPVMTRAQIDEMFDFLLSVNRLYFSEDELKELILEELKTAVSEDKTPEETASQLTVTVQDYFNSL